MKRIILTTTMLCALYAYSQEGTKIVTSNQGVAQEVFKLQETVFEQPDPSVEELKSRLKSLEAWKASMDVSSLTSYHKNLNNFSNAISIINEVNNTYLNIYLDRKEAEAYNLLASINNSESDALGFKFSDVIIENLEKNINASNSLKTEDKTIFINGLTNLISGIGSLLTPTSLIGSAIGFISSFVPQNVKTAVKNPLDKSFIEKFKTEIKAYNTYYNTLAQNNSLFNQDLHSLDAKYTNLPRSINSYIQAYVEPLKYDFNKPIVGQVNTLFNFSQSGIPGFDHYAINNKEEIKKVIGSIPTLIKIVEDLNNYFIDYNKIILENFDKNSQLLNKAKDLPKAKKDVITHLENKLVDLKGDANNQGFSTKFSKNIEQLNNYLKAFQ
ncbi:hypothetical protein [Sphingobacterium kitahiroshimense]|uniref:hypothetical protein n=1 Tax=Sphingobacterium kitahiroshimense TaxID=470446 RepID=UPI00320B0D4A